MKFIRTLLDDRGGTTIRDGRGWDEARKDRKRMELELWCLITFRSGDANLNNAGTTHFPFLGQLRGFEQGFGARRTCFMVAKIL